MATGIIKLRLKQNFIISCCEISRFAVKSNRSFLLFVGTVIKDVLSTTFVKSSFRIRPRNSEKII